MPDYDQVVRGQKFLLKKGDIQKENPQIDQTYAMS